MSARVLEVGCTLDIEQTHDNFHAHLVLDGDIAIHPGDQVLLHGAPVLLAFGEKRSERRRATITRAGLLRRAWTKVCARLDLHELYEVSFTPRRLS